MWRKVAAAVVTAIVHCVWSYSALAGGWQGDDVIGAEASSTTDGDEGSRDDDSVRCEWGGDAVYGAGTSYTHDLNTFIHADARLWRINYATGEAWVRSHRTCTQDGVVVSTSLGWRQVSAPDPRILAQSVYDEVVRQIPLPEPALSPVGPGFVNLGMWLAVVEPDPISLTATAGAVWATTSAELVSTTFDMGDGTIVTCEGAGDPIPDAARESIEASPTCGHTYTTLNSREPFDVTITSTWRVSWSGSGGVGGDLGTLDRTATLEYRVLEIQTVGS